MKTTFCRLLVCNAQCIGIKSFQYILMIYTVSPKNWATFIFTVTIKCWPILIILSLSEREIIFAVI